MDEWLKPFWPTSHAGAKSLCRIAAKVPVEL
jgi:hypothetical protein